MKNERTKEETLEQLEYLAHKATKGRWWIDSHGSAMVAFHDHDIKYVFIVSDKMGKAQRNKETGNLSPWANDWDATYIATAQPETILMLLADLKALKEENRILKGEANA